ncbi:MAG: serine hydrolase [Flavobacteriales bacterium]|nr:serine hydrolase [Flavobacteriales bacterium]
MRFLSCILFLSFFHLSYTQINDSLLIRLGNTTLQKVGANGGYLSILQGNDIVFSEAFGYNDPITKTKLTDSSLFPISSNTKAFNAILLSQLAEAKKLEFDKPIKTYLPDLELKSDFITNELTLIDLLTHRWGIPRYDFTYYLLSETEKSNPNKAVFEKLKYLDNSSSFRTQFSYGNNQYILAAYLLEHLTGDKWEDRLKHHILEPLQMHNTHCNLASYLQNQNSSLGYQNKKAANISSVQSLYDVSGMGNMFSTVNDLENWASFLLNGNSKILSKDWLDYNLSGHFAIGYEEPYDGFSPIEYGFGWYIFDYFGHKVVLHHGDNVGHQSLIVLMPDDNIAWIAMMNEGMRTNSFPFRMTFYLFEMIAGKEMHDWNKLLERDETIYLRHPLVLNSAKKAPQLPLKEYAGTYTHQGFGDIFIDLKNEQLLLTAGTYFDSLEHSNQNSFTSYSEDFLEDFMFQFIVEENRVLALETDLIEPSLPFIRFEKRD